MDNADSASSSQEARQPAMRMAPAGNCLVKQRDSESGERNGCVLQRGTPSEISEETPKFRSRFDGNEHKAAAFKISTWLICRAFLSNVRRGRSWPGSCDVNVCRRVSWARNSEKDTSMFKKLLMTTALALPLAF